MQLKKTLAAAATAAALGLSALAGAGVVNAEKPDPWDPGRGHDNWEPRQWDNDWDDTDWYKWYDREPPWGWGPPPRAVWQGVLPPPWEPPPPPFNYWGSIVYPVWDPGFNAWGFWLFGIFIPLVAVG